VTVASATTTRKVRTPGAHTGARAGARAALDVILTDAALAPGPDGRFLAPGPAANSRAAWLTAASPGSVVLSNEVFELIHCKPRATLVYGTPLLIVPPTINKFYVLDLARGGVWSST
jgi:hypothetical protein